MFGRNKTTYPGQEVGGGFSVHQLTVLETSPPASPSPPSCDGPTCPLDKQGDSERALNSSPSSSSHTMNHGTMSLTLVQHHSLAQWKTQEDVLVQPQQPPFWPFCPRTSLPPEVFYSHGPNLIYRRTLPCKKSSRVSPCLHINSKQVPPPDIP